MSSPLTAQLRSVYLYTYFSGMMFWYGIEQLFLEEIGDGVFARGVTLAVFSFTMFLATIPAGAISDIWGRVRSLKFAIAMMMLSIVILALSHSVLVYSIGAVFFALFWSFDEGAKEAFVYDLLADEEQESQYQKVLGRIYAALLFGAATANFSSGFIAEATSLRTTYWLALIPCGVALYFLIKLHEPEHHRQVGKNILSQLDDAAKALAQHRTLLIVAISMVLIYLVSDIAGEFAQPAIVEHTDSAILVGLAWGVMGLNSRRECASGKYNIPSSRYHGIHSWLNRNIGYCWLWVMGWGRRSVGGSTYLCGGSTKSYPCVSVMAAHPRAHSNRGLATRAHHIYCTYGRKVKLLLPLAVFEGMVGKLTLWGKPCGQSVLRRFLPVPIKCKGEHECF